MFGREQSRLSIPFNPIFQTQNELAKDRFVISLMHHPLSWFTDSASRDLARSIGDMASIHLFGHLHEPEPEHRVSAAGQTTYLQAPALFTDRKRPNGYCAIFLASDPLHRKFEYRTYFDGPRRFGAGENVIPGGGIFYPNADSEEYWRRFPRAISERKFRAWLGGRALTDLVARTSDPITRKAIYDYFVAPPLVQIDLTKTEMDEIRSEKRASLSDIMESDRNILFSGPPEHGHTTLAYNIAYELLSNAKAGPKPRFPLYVNVDHIMTISDISA
jgi:hypothetical protein